MSEEDPTQNSNETEEEEKTEEMSEEAKVDKSDEEDQSQKTDEDEQARKLFMGGLNNNTTEETLKTFFSQYGEVTDIVIIRFPDTKKSRGFGFITFSNKDEAETCFAAKPHLIDDKNVDIKRATSKEEAREEAGEKPEEENSEIRRKVFIGGLNYQTTEEGIKEYFAKFGEVVDAIVMKNKETDKSRGFGFVTFSDQAMVDEVQKARPHTIEEKEVETKRATPKDQLGKGESGNTAKKIFVGGIKDDLEDDDLKEYFSKYGTVTKVDHMKNKTTGQKRGFGFVEFDDYDPVDVALLDGKKHEIKEGLSVDIRKAVDTNDAGRGGGRMRRGGRGGGFGRGFKRGGGMGGFGGGYGGGYGPGGYGGGYGGGYWGGDNQAWGSWGAPGAGAGSWGQYGWGGDPSANYWGGPQGGGGPVRNQIRGSARNAPYNGRGASRGGGSG